MARIFRPPNRLAILVDRPGGLLRAIAIERAAWRVADRRQPAMEAIAILIGTLERMAASSLPLLPGELPVIKRVIGQLVSLALTYDLDALAEVGMKLCDLLAAFARDSRAARGPVRVHVQALRLFAPDEPAPAPEVAARMLAELDRLLAHFSATPPPLTELQQE